MLKSEEIRRQVAQRLRELLPKAKSWEEQTDVKIAGHAAGLVVRFRLVDQEHTVVLEVEALARAATVTLGHTQNVVRRPQELAWVEHDESQGMRLGKPAGLLESWCESYTYRANEIGSYAAPERVTRAFLSAIARAATAEGRRYAFTLNAGLSLVAPSLRVPAVHCYLEGDPAPVAAALGLRATAEGDGAVHFLAPYDPGVFHALLEKGGLTVVCLPQLYADLLRYERRGREQAEHLRREARGY